jgi:FtsP/CotA-like multicopper oxidase with cupredoxin domain
MVTPFRLHGFFFQVLDDHGEPARPLAWKDAVDVPYNKTVRLAVCYDERPGATGMWVFHCHILDHAEGGLMAWSSWEPIITCPIRKTR